MCFSSFISKNTITARFGSFGAPLVVVAQSKTIVANFGNFQFLETFKLPKMAIMGNQKLARIGIFPLLPKSFEPSKVAEKSYFWFPKIATFGNF